jgi:hypothetical protein
VATAFALAAAFLNAAFDFCLGCEVHLRLARALGRPVARYVDRTALPGNGTTSTDLTTAPHVKENAYAS